MKKWDIDFPAPLSQRPVLGPHRQSCVALSAGGFLPAPRNGRRELIPQFRWKLPGAQIGAEPEFEWRDNRVFLLEPDGSAVE
jgi:hypothetical protein